MSHQTKTQEMITTINQIESDVNKLLTKVSRANNGTREVLSEIHNIVLEVRNSSQSYEEKKPILQKLYQAVSTTLAEVLMDIQI